QGSHAAPAARGAFSRARAGERRAPHAARRPAVARPAQEPQGLCRPRPSARGPAAHEARRRFLQLQECEAQVMAETINSLEDLASAAPTPPATAPVYEQKLDAQGRAYATGKRK